MCFLFRECEETKTKKNHKREKKKKKKHAVVSVSSNSSVSVRALFVWTCWLVAVPESKRGVEPEQVSKPSERSAECVVVVALERGLERPFTVP